MTKKKDYSEDAKNFFFNEDNKKKKKELENKYGMKYSGTNSEAEPEIINQFLSNVKAFEDAFEIAESKKLIEMLGFPKFEKIDKLKNDELETEIAEVLAIYADHDINIDVLEENDVSDEEFYNFLTVELPQHESDFFQVEGMTTNYIYEEFHPNDKLDIKQSIDYLITFLPSKSMDHIKTYMGKDNLEYNGIKMTQTMFIKELIKLFKNLKRDSEKKIDFKKIELIDESNGKAELNIIIKNKSVGKNKKIGNHTVLNLQFELNRSEYGGWDINGCTVL